MSISNITAKKSWIKVGDPRAAAAYAGWHDALAGRPLNPIFSDHPNQYIACAYMAWRYRAVEVKRVFGTVPVWHTMKSVPKRVMDTFINAARIERANGNLSCVPTKRLPDDPNLEFK